MKFLSSQLTYLLSQRETRANLRALFRYLLVLGGTITVYSIVFHALMLYEGQNHSWLTGAYWTLTVMSTLGFGDITFHSDIGRLFSITVLLSGIVLLLIVLPFAFIRFFYAPWLEAQLRLRAPREAEADASGHVIVCKLDSIALGLMDRLEHLGIRTYVIEPDPTKAAGMIADGFNAVAGALDSVSTYHGLRAEHARLLFANLGDADNTNVTLTVREAFPDLPVVALADDKDAVDILELAGATHVLPLKHRLGEQLASRVDMATPHAHVVGRFNDLVIAEFPVRPAGLAGRTVRDTRLRELTGLSIVASWERGRLVPAGPGTMLTESSVPVVIGTEEQMTELDAMFAIYQPNENPMIVIGGGKVGRAAARALKQRDAAVHVIESNPELHSFLASIADEVVIGDAAELETIRKAGIERAPSVVLTTSNDATNIYLAVYCRRLNPACRVVSRITHERNLEAIHRAGADSVLSFGTLGVQSVLSIALGRETVVIGEGVDVFVEPIPASLDGKTLAQSGIGANTGLNVIALQTQAGAATQPSAGTLLTSDAQLVLCGTAEQRETYRGLYP